MSPVTSAARLSPAPAAAELGRRRARLAAYRDAGITVLSITPVGGQDPVATVAQLRELVDDL